VVQVRGGTGREIGGRVFQTDIDEPKKPDHVPQGTWKRFLDRCDFQTLYFDYTIPDA
jgi:hypothetical protein